MRRARAYALASLLLPALVAAGSRVSAAQVITDALYNSNHPRLLFTNAELPALRAKVLDGGVDDDTYATVRTVVRDGYPAMTPTDALGQWYGLESFPSIGLVGHMEVPADEDALALGRSLTIYIADTWAPDFDEANSSMRLRSLALGYDMFFAGASEAERVRVRDEIVSYIQKMIWNNAYRMFEYRPYLGNHSAMLGAALGLAAIALDGETEAYLVRDAMAMADRITNNLLMYQFDPAGSYGEGGFYALWTLRNLIPYFEARRRFDGHDFGASARVRDVEEWLAYEMLPEGLGRSHNLNDSPSIPTAFAIHPTYFDWAMSAWNSGLAAWLWDHTTGAEGYDLGGTSDRVGTILWYRPIPPVTPDTVLPAHRVWADRGLYYFRSGWSPPPGAADVVFSFYSGKFQGGHAQEDQNQFALYAYGEKFAIDHGAGNVAKESAAHNMVFIDGAGQHNAGSSIGTDGRIAVHVLGGSADYLEGDATAAYSTYSEFNAPDVPFRGTDWSWGYTGANPVQLALRRVLVVHGGDLPYMVLMDDIDKDGAVHAYEWRMHTPATHAVDVSANPVTITGGSAGLELHLLNPPPGAVTFATQAFENGNQDPNSTLLRVTRSAVNPSFSFLLMPHPNGTDPPSVSTRSYEWGYACDVNWGAGDVDYLVRNDTGLAHTHGPVTSDGRVTLVRKRKRKFESYLAAEASSLVLGSTAFVSIEDGPADFEVSGSTVHIDRYDADFRFLDTGITRVLYHEQDLPFAATAGYVVPEATTAVGGAPAVPGALSLHAWPNPFNPGTTIRVDGAAGARAQVAVYDVAGRRVRVLWEGTMRAASRSLYWDGRDETGARVASGTYFLRARTPAGTHTLKLTVLK